MTTKQELNRQLEQMGLKPTDTVLIHTSFKAVGDVEGGPDGFLDVFCTYLDRGLFLVPTHTWGNVTREQPVYDVTKTVPCIGLIPRTAAFRQDGIRSLHPTHSIWAHGEKAAAFIAGEEWAKTPAPVGGCWSRLGDLGAKILLIGVGHGRNTFIHSIDELAELHDRLDSRCWPVTVIDRQGRRMTHPYQSHGETGSENFGIFEPALIETGAQSMGKLGNADVRIVDAAKCRQTILKIYGRTRENLCLTRQEIPESLWR